MATPESKFVLTFSRWKEKFLKSESKKRLSELEEERIVKRPCIDSAVEKATLKIGIPSKVARVVIGKKGGVIKNMISKTGAQIKILSNVHIDTEDCIFLISGTVNNIKKMYNSILEKMVSVREPTVKIIVPDRIVGTLIGKRFICFKEIEQETGIHLKIAPKSSEYICTERPLTMTGKLECIKNASKILLRKIMQEVPLANHMPKSRTNNPSSNGVQSSSSQHANPRLSVEDKLERLIDILKTNSSLSANLFSEL
ncbi:hypothetical protein AVEN_176956-1 [Araneus ventricosus]|uniref:K Homology domain-containing protein n=1 Tax=Araneus ventricosus TaxID=182803 RepID=A0A4Y2WXQ4_ARAVE|nr:hypothetical protein AVEN_176956-1 [Araneus ventricosus]